jgi:hypothetical protein
MEMRALMHLKRPEDWSSIRSARHVAFSATFEGAREVRDHLATLIRSVLQNDWR